MFKNKICFTLDDIDAYLTKNKSKFNIDDMKRLDINKIKLQEITLKKANVDKQIQWKERMVNIDE